MDECVSYDCFDQIFIGREWVFAKIEKTVDIRTQNCLNTAVTAIFGCAGSGKTILIRQMLQIQRFSDYLLAFYECSEKSDIRQFIASIESQIKDKLEIEICQNHSYDDEVITNDDIFRQSILFPLLETKCVNTDEQRYIIIIDSIDTNGDICQLISNHIHLLPKWLHLIVSARPKRRKGFTKMFSGSRKIVIDDMRKLNVINDMKLYIMHRIKQLNCRPLGTTGRKALNQIGIKSNGCFLYVKLILDCFERGLMRTDEVDSIGCTLNGLYLALCSKLFDSNPDSEIDYKSIISITIASIDCKTTVESLNKCLRLDNNYLDSIIDHLCLYSILQLNSDKTIQLSHNSLIEWITDVKHCTRRFLCDKSYGHIINAFCDSLPSVNDYHFHILNSNITNYDIYHYALWLLLTIDSYDISIELLSELIEDSPIVYFIQTCKNSLQETKSSSECFRVCNTSSSPIARNSNLRKRKEKHLDKYELSLKMPESDSEYNELIRQFKRALLKCDIPTLRDILTNDSTDMLNHYIIKQKTPYFWAIKSGNTEIVELLIEFDADVNTVCDIETGLTPLMIAVSQNSLEICELLLDADADVDACDVLSRTPLVYAIVQHSSPKIIELLLFWGAHTDYIDDLGRSLLCLASNESQCSVDCIRLLLAVGCDELHRDNNGRTALHYAALNGSADIIEALLDIGGDTLQHARDNEGKLALHDSAIGGFVNACKLLISNESINVLSHDGKSALRLAAMNAHLDVVTLLVESGADINYVDADSRSTLYCVASNAANDLTLVNILQHLVKLGADLEIQDLEGRTALMVSAWQGMTHVVETLIELGANVNAVDNEGRNSAHMAAWNGHTDIVAILVEAGCDVNHVSSTQGATPLLVAAQQGHIDACSVLLEAGCDASHADFYGRNAQDVANNCGHRDIVILLDSRVINAGEQCPTLSSHASTAETAAIGEIEALFDAPKSKVNSRDLLHNKRDNSRKHKKIMSISKITKLLH